MFIVLRCKWLFGVARVARRQIDISRSYWNGGSQRQREEECSNCSFNHGYCSPVQMLFGVAGIARRQIDIGSRDRSHGGQGKGEEQGENGFFHHWFKFLVFV
jgi:hypothetical protein